MHSTSVVFSSEVSLSALPHTPCITSNVDDLTDFRFILLQDAKIAIYSVLYLCSRLVRQYLLLGSS